MVSFGMLPNMPSGQRLRFQRGGQIDEEEARQQRPMEMVAGQPEHDDLVSLPLRDEEGKTLPMHQESQAAEAGATGRASETARQQHFNTHSNRHSFRSSRRQRPIRGDLPFTALGADARSKSHDASALDLYFLENVDPEFPIYNHKQQQTLLKQLWARDEELRLKQQELQLREAELKDIKAQLLEQLKALSQQKEDIKMMETEMNQQKLKMLVKFDKIKYLEDFYNQQKYREGQESGSQQPADQIKLYIEIDDGEMIRLAERIYLNNARKVQLELQRKKWAL